MDEFPVFLDPRVPLGSYVLVAADRAQAVLVTEKGYVFFRVADRGRMLAAACRTILGETDHDGH